MRHHESLASLPSNCVFPLSCNRFLTFICCCFARLKEDSVLMACDEYQLTSLFLQFNLLFTQLKALACRLLNCFLRKDGFHLYTFPNIELTRSLLELPVILVKILIFGGFTLTAKAKMKRKLSPNLQLAGQVQYMTDFNTISGQIWALKLLEALWTSALYPSLPDEV
ncbi:uncharacterized protein LOC135638758 isoform X2 [Musa acuminata AAA Group]|uniref:uncharacterized protein LOC135638758 isoform X2 n=1 Tax=Musa acuminata AAA Group TaxID=214697 RepID=UPI0031DACD54